MNRLVIYPMLAVICAAANSGRARIRPPRSSRAARRDLRPQVRPGADAGRLHAGETKRGGDRSPGQRRLAQGPRRTAKFRRAAQTRLHRVSRRVRRRAEIHVLEQAGDRPGQSASFGSCRDYKSIRAGSASKALRCGGHMSLLDAMWADDGDPRPATRSIARPAACRPRQSFFRLPTFELRPDGRSTGGDLGPLAHHRASFDFTRFDPGFGRMSK